MTADLPYLLDELDDAAAQLASCAAILSGLIEIRAVAPDRVSQNAIDRAAADVTIASEALRAWGVRVGRALAGQSYACPHVLDLEDEPRDDLDMTESFDEGTVVPAEPRKRAPGRRTRTRDGLPLGWPGVLA